MEAWTPVKLTGVSDVTRVGEDGFPSIPWQSPQTKADADEMRWHPRESVGMTTQYHPCFQFVPIISHICL